ncbi:uncharacterized protein TM35_000851070 [Trypanosoma theileri]|uniref:Uncharacterized protein n=1 Tax=Trypanosoma theileri TaxID=67003 RepID=A0A1X0NG96_9TRYP|nr:uncharacterized protein TM35_000851070 [Trypanosoma theileri]ORC82662.1 hypothetical protein TM35_000851070 [Trypanosoma theileri]
MYIFFFLPQVCFHIPMQWWLLFPISGIMKVMCDIRWCRPTLTCGCSPNGVRDLVVFGGFISDWVTRVFFDMRCGSGTHKEEWETGMCNERVRTVDTHSCVVFMS